MNVFWRRRKWWMHRDPRKTFRYRWLKFVKTLQVLLGLKSRREAELELELFVHDIELEYALFDAFKEVMDLTREAEAEEQTSINQGGS